MKKLIFKVLVLAVLPALFATASVSAKSVGDIKGYIYYSDYVAYINDQPIPCYEYGEHVVLIAEDLADYGFYISWSDDTRSLSIERSAYNYVNRLFAPESNAHRSGTRAMPVFDSDTKVYFEGRLIKSHNLDGKSAIYADDLAACAHTYERSDVYRSLRLNYESKSSELKWEYFAVNPYVEPFARDIGEGFAFTLRNNSDGDRVSFEVEGGAGDFQAIRNINLSECMVSFGIYNAGSSNLGDFYGELRNNINIQYNERINKNSDERQKSLSYVYRVYINDVRIDGELAYAQGGNRSDFIFLFNKEYALNEIETIKLEVGGVVIE